MTTVNSLNYECRRIERLKLFCFSIFSTILKKTKNLAKELHLVRSNKSKLGS